MSYSRIRGLSLGSVLLAVTLLIVLAFTLASVSTTHLQLSTRSNVDLKASNLARSTASLAIARLLENPDLGKTATEEDEIILETDDGRGYVTFFSETPRESNFAHSTNNLDGTNPSEGGFGEPVPAGSVHLVAQGESGGVKRTVEVVLRVPPFPWAVAADGTVETRRGVLIGSLPEGVWPPPPESDLLPADLLANSRDEEAIILGEDSKILGDVETPGQVQLVGDRRTIAVEGEIRSGARPVELPKLRASDYDPAAGDGVFDDLNSLQDTGQRIGLSGASRRTGDLVLSSGLDLEGAHLFVDGNLTVRGGVSGNGIIVCTGDVAIESGLTLEGATEVAIVADGRVRLKGGGKASSTVRGVFYAGGGLEAQEMTLVGTLLAGEAASGIELENVSVYAEEPKPTNVSGMQPTLLYLGLQNPNRVGSYIQRVGIYDPMNPPSPGFTPLMTLNLQPSDDGGFPILATLNGIAGSQQLVLDGDQDFDAIGLEAMAFLASNIPRAEDIDRLTGLQNVMEAFDYRAAVNAQSSGSSDTSIDLYGDISRFLPFEDRVRVVSWLER